MNNKYAIIIGAGPAGLTAAYELLDKTDIIPIVIEKSKYMGGISRTVDYKGNKIDIGGHRFFSKSDKVMNWWFNFFPLENNNTDIELFYQGKSKKINSDNLNNSSKKHNVMLIRNRKSRIYFLRNFFTYPINLSLDTLKKLGFVRLFRILFSYLYRLINPIVPEKNLEDFFINRFGKELYNTFFKSYTEKVWGYPCNKISAEWGAQRIKGLSIIKTIKHYFLMLSNKKNDIKQKNIETSLIEKFLYPKYGPGQMWENVAEKIIQMGGRIIINSEVNLINFNGSNVCSVEYITNNKKETIEGNYFFSTMPVKNLIRSFNKQVPTNIKKISEGLIYRDFVTVGLLLEKLIVKDGSTKSEKLIDDNWIYIQEPDVKLGRLQIFNNWSPHMVKDSQKVWVGLEYFCDKYDEIWNKTDNQMLDFAVNELDLIDIIDKADVLDGTVIKMEKTYPAYFGTYNKFNEIIKYIDNIENLFLIGRNGMHKYNNQDHSMLSAMQAVNNIINQVKSKKNIWEINSEQIYQEEIKK